MVVSFKERIEKIFKFFKKHQSLVFYILLFYIIYLSTYIRTRNLGLLKDITTGKYIPAALDPFAVYRYSKYLLENSSFMVIDMMRYVPLGFKNPVLEFGTLSGFIVYFYKFLSFFNSGLTFDYFFVLYPVISFAFTLIFFFFLVNLLFGDKKISILATSLFAFSSSFLHRTVAGFSDKEALAIMTMTLAFLFYVMVWRVDTIKFFNLNNKKKAIIFGGLAGFFTGFTGSVWGGVDFIYVILGFTVLVALLLNRYSNDEIYGHIFWVIFSGFSLFFIFYTRKNFVSFVLAVTNFFMIFSFMYCIIKLLLDRYNLYLSGKEFSLNFLNSIFNPLFKSFKFAEAKFSFLNNKLHKLPRQILILVVTFFVSFITALIFRGPTYMFNFLEGIYFSFAQPVKDMGRWGLTVAEAKATYVEEWFGYLGKEYFFLVLIASVVLFWNYVKNIKKYRYFLLGGYIFLLSTFTFSKYAQNTIFNGESFVARLMLFGGILIFIIFVTILYFYGYYKNKSLFKSLLNLDKVTILLLVWLFVMIASAKARVRLVMMLVPIGAILFSYLFFYAYNLSLKIKIKPVKFFCIILLALFLISPFGAEAQSIKYLKKIPIINSDGILIEMYDGILGMASGIGLSFHGQWQVAMDWVRKNTSSDAVFAHWWDYGYWVQTMGERATISDGGNVRGAINYFTARYLMTGTNDMETLDFLYANNVTHILYDPTDIGKYTAFSSIGSDINYDRFSWINTFRMNPEKVQKADSYSLLLYEGNSPLDEDFEVQDVKFFRRNSAVIGFLVPVFDNPSGIEIKQPKAVLANADGQIMEVPLNCVYFNNNELIYEGDGFDGCLVLIPFINGPDQVNMIGSGLYISERVRKGMFARYYLYGKSSDNFAMVYDGSDVTPLSDYQGRIIGPIRIWQVNYPAGIEDKSFYREERLPDVNLSDVNLAYQ